MLTSSTFGDVTTELSSRPDRSHAPSVHSDYANPITLHLGGLLQRFVTSPPVMAGPIPAVVPPDPLMHNAPQPSHRDHPKYANLCLASARRPLFYFRERPDRFGYSAPPSWGAFLYRPLIIVLRLKIMLPSGAGRTEQPDVPNQLNVYAQSSYRYAQNALRIVLPWLSQKATIIETKECPRPNQSRGDSPNTF